jgi:hypothetical protein
LLRCNSKQGKVVPPKKGVVSQVTIFRIIAIICGSISLGLGWSALSEGYSWNEGYNARVGTSTTSPTLAWVVYGAILVAAGIFPWKWFLNRRKR